MPFTLSHAAAALPFRKLKPIWPALVVGTFAPDLQYFIWISDEDRSGHRFPEAILVTLPLALLLLWIFERCLKGPVLELFPSSVQRRLHDKVQPLLFTGWKQFASIVLWIAVGLVTHVVWDSFTHWNTWTFEHWELLRIKVDVPYYHPMFVFKILQHSSTLFGLLVLAAWFFIWFRKSAPVPKASLRELSSLRKLTVVVTIGVVAILAGYPVAIYRVADHFPPVSQLFYFVTVFEAITLLFCTQLLLYSLVRNCRSRSRRTAAIRMDEQRS